MLKTEKQTIMEFLGQKPEVKRGVINNLAEDLKGKGYKVAIIRDCKKELPEELKEDAKIEAANLWIHFQIQSEIIQALSMGVDYILIERGIRQTELTFEKLLKNGKISQEKQDNFKRLFLRELRPDKVIEVGRLEDV